MPNRRQGGRKCRSQIIGHAVDLKTLTFPMKVMVMRNGGITCFGNEFGDGKPQWDIERDGQRIFGNKNFQIELAHKFV